MTSKWGVGSVRRVLMVVALMVVPFLVASCADCDICNMCKKDSCKTNGATYTKGKTCPSGSAYKTSDCPTGSTYKEGSAYTGSTSQINWNNLTNQARTQNKLVYIYFTGSWCPNCRNFERDTLSKSDAQNALNQVIYVRANIDKEQNLSQKFNITGVPSGVLLKYQNGELQQVDKHVGGLDQDAFIRFLQP